MPPVEVVIRAPQGWGKTWFAERIAEDIAKRTKVKVLILDFDVEDEVVKREGGWIAIGQKYGAIVRTTCLTEDEEREIRGER